MHPSRPSSPFWWFAFLLYDTKSRKVNPSCAVMKVEGVIRLSRVHGVHIRAVNKTHVTSVSFKLPTIRMKITKETHLPHSDDAN